MSQEANNEKHSHPESLRDVNREESCSMDGGAFGRGGRIRFSVPFPVSGTCYASVKIENLRVCVVWQK